MKQRKKMSLGLILVGFLFISTLQAETTEMLLPTPLPQGNNLGISYLPASVVKINLLPQNLAIPVFFGEQKLELARKRPESKDISFATYENKGIKKQTNAGGLEKTLFQASLMTFAALNVADYISTREGLKYPGLREKNHLLKPFVKNPYAFATVKLGLLAVSYFNMKFIYKKIDKRLAWAIITLSNFALSYVVVKNFRLIQDAKN